MDHSTPRIEFDRVRQIAPDAYAGMSALAKAAKDSGLDPKMVELVKIRVSHINGCHFCLQFHTNIARSLKIEMAKIDLLADWQNSQAFSPTERAALAWAESLTAMSSRRITDDDFKQLKEQFADEEIVFLTYAIGTINSWNRIAEGLLFTPPAPVTP